MNIPCGRHAVRAGRQSVEGPCGDPTSAAGGRVGNVVLEALTYSGRVDRRTEARITVVYDQTWPDRWRVRWRRCWRRCWRPRHRRASGTPDEVAGVFIGVAVVALIAGFEEDSPPDAIAELRRGPIARGMRIKIVDEVIDGRPILIHHIQFAKGRQVPVVLAVDVKRFAGLCRQVRLRAGSSRTICRIQEGGKAFALIAGSNRVGRLGAAIVNRWVHPVNSSVIPRWRLAGSHAG